MRRLDQQGSRLLAQIRVQSSKMKLTRYEELAQVQKPDFEGMQLVAQGLIAGRNDNVSFWQQQIRTHYPGQEYAWAHDIQSPFAQISLAEMIDELGQHGEAIHVGEQAVALNHWHWGHYVVAGFYLEKDDEAEGHLQQAITYGGSDPIVSVTVSSWPTYTPDSSRLPQPRSSIVELFKQRL